MVRFDGSLARKFQFGEITTTFGPRRVVRAEPKGGVRLAAGIGATGPDKYKVLDHRRRQAQIKARRLLDL